MLGRQQYQCQQGKEINLKKKENYKEKKNAILTILTIHLQNTENLYRIKKRCLIVFNTKKLFILPKYEILTCTGYNRDKACCLISKTNSFFQRKSKREGQRENVLDEEYHLSYLIQLPKGKHCYHNTGKATAIAKLLDLRVNDFIQKLIRSGCRRVKELESRAMDFATDVLFEGVCSPDRYRGMFYPERSKVKNLITYVKMETRLSKIDQENVQHFVSSCREAKIHVTPR